MRNCFDSHRRPALEISPCRSSQGPRPYAVDRDDPRTQVAGESSSHNLLNSREELVRYTHKGAVVCIKLHGHRVGPKLLSELLLERIGQSSVLLGEDIRAGNTIIPRLVLALPNEKHSRRMRALTHRLLQVLRRAVAESHLGNHLRIGSDAVALDSKVSGHTAGLDHFTL